MYILDVANKKLLEVDIVPATSKEIPLKKDGWNFNWRKLFKDNNTRTFVLRTKDESLNIEGILLLKVDNEMLIMDLIEIAPHNIGSTNKKYDYVAGCLIAFACRESFKIDGNYKGFLTFFSKSDLIELYSNKYGATQALGQRMYIDPNKGLKLIDEYYNRKKIETS